MSENSVSESITVGEPIEAWRDEYRDHLIRGGVAPADAHAIATNPMQTRSTWENVLAKAKANKSAKPEHRKRATKSVNDSPSTPRKTKSPTTAKKGVSLAKTSKQQQRIIDIGANIALNPPVESDLIYTSTVLCHVGFPRAEIAERSFMRRSGDAWINIQAGILDEGDGPVEQPVPYGPVARLAMAHLATYAIRNKTREIPTGKSGADFLRSMGIPDTQGARYKTLHQQIHALGACRIQMGYLGRTVNSQIVEQFDAWARTSDDVTRWPGILVLSEPYYTDLLKSGGTPLDIRALHGLTGSALALDVYMWLAHRLHRIGARPVILRWKSLREQFGQEFNDPKSFKESFLTALRHVQTVYPTAQVKPVTGGLMLIASPPPIPFKDE